MVTVSLTTAQSAQIAPTGGLQIEVGTANVAELQAFCEARVKEIEEASAASARSESALELASVHDPIAVGSIRALLDRGFGIDAYLVPTLGDIESLQSVQTLTVALNNIDYVVVEQAHFALKKLAGSPDTTVSAAAKELLSRTEK